MPTLLALILGSVASYLVGSIPTAYIFGRLYKGIDIRQHGSGNVGATNVFRVLGKGPGTLVLLLDIAKGVLATTLVGDLFGIESVLGRVVLGMVVVAGHNWTVFLKFKGGKGIATSLGVLIGLAIKLPMIRPVVFITLLAWLIVFLISRYVSLSSLVASAVLPVSMVLTGQSPEVIFLGIIFCTWVFVRHRPNMKRLLAGTENRVSFGSHQK